MSSLNDTLFGPLGTQFCLYFYILSAIAFIFMVMSILGFILHLFSKKMDMKVVLGVIMVAGTYGIVYMQNRLLYNMCNRSENAPVVGGTK
jgi:hypothetical protein